MSKEDIKVKGIKSLSQTLIISISMQSDGVNLWFFKLRLFILTEFIVWNIVENI